MNYVWAAALWCGGPSFVETNTRVTGGVISES